MVLVDTTVASLLHPSKRATARWQQYEPHLLGQMLAVSFQTVAELFQWAEERHWGTGRRRELERVISRFVVIPYDTDLARAWAQVMTAAKQKGRRLEAGDGWIAATAIHRKLPLITDDRDFVGLGLADLQVICYA